MRPLTDRTLERYLLGELSRAERQDVERALESDETAAARLEDLERSNADILTAYPSGEMAAQIKDRLDSREERVEGNIRPFPSRSGRRLRYIIPAAAVAALLIVAFPVRQTIAGAGIFGGETTRMKGLGARIDVYRNAAAGPEQLAEGARAHVGDLLRLSYVAGGARHGVIFSVDGRGVVTYHYPDVPTGEAPELEPGGEIPLAFSYQLDDAPEFERFFFVTAHEPFSVEEIDQEVRRLAADREAARQGDLRLRRSFEQYSLTLIKGDNQ